MTDAAIRVAGPAPDCGDAIDWLAPRLGHNFEECHFLYSTIAWQYFLEASKSRGIALIEAAGEIATEKSPLVWLRMEADGMGPGAALTLKIWPGNLTVKIGRADFHGRWVEILPGMDEFLCGFTMQIKSTKFVPF